MVKTFKKSSSPEGKGWILSGGKLNTLLDGVFSIVCKMSRAHVPYRLLGKHKSICIDVFIDQLGHCESLQNLVCSIGDSGHHGLFK